jgi:hypothetical protein
VEWIKEPYFNGYNGIGEIMKCQSCSIEVSKEFKAALSKNVCPACGKPILASGNMAAFVPLCEVISQNFTVSANQVRQDLGLVTQASMAAKQEADIEALATLIISTFNVRSKSDKEEAPQQSAKVAEPGSDEEHKQKQMSDAKSALQKLRDEAYQDALREQWGMTPGEEALDPDVGEALADQMGSNAGPDVGQAMVEQKQKIAYSRMISGAGKVKR